MKKTLLKAVLFCLPFFVINTSHGLEIADVKIPETVQVGSNTLKLNGAGIRSKLFFKVYVAALYLAETKNSTKEILEAAGAKQINLTMLREMQSDTLAQAFNEGIKRNTDQAEMEKLNDQFQKLDQLFLTVPKLKEGDVISIEWVPEVGTKIALNGKELGKPFANVAFFNALLRIWLGKDPVSEPLKNKLLGGSVDR